MIETQLPLAPPAAATSASGTRALPLLALLFAGSGCAALIYELVWFQMLQLAIGMQSVCLGVLLATFMGGLCLGSLGLPRYLKPGRHPLRIYALLEAGTGLLGLLVLWILPLVDHVYFAAVGYGMPNFLLRALLAALCLLPPTILMGASLPALVRWVEGTPRGVRWWGYLYGGNTAGAVFGCLWAGFYLLRLYNMATATYIAVLINFVVAAGSWLLATRVAASTELEAETTAAPAPVDDTEAASPTAVYIAIALSGATALGAEVVWTRLFGMLFGATVYAFSIILAVFLVGLAGGSGIGAAMLRGVRARVALGWSQILLVAGIAWTAWMIADWLPFWPIDPLLVSHPRYTFEIDLVRAAWAILPPTLCWGASFPLALAAAARRGEDPGKPVGQVYAANTAGGIVGALAVSLILIPAVGTHNSERLLALVAAAAGCVMLAPAAFRRRKQAVVLAAAVALSLLLVVQMDGIPGELVAYGRKLAINYGSSHMVEVVEGRNESIAITHWNDGATEVDVNGHVEATTEPYDMKLQRMVGHIPALLQPNPRSVLGIGFGAGVSAGTFTRYPGIEKITICEIEPQIPPTSTRHFSDADYDVKDNPRTHIVFDDARHYLLTTRDKFDVIASDPLDVFVKGTAAIYSREYFESVKSHLNPGGMFTLYVPLYESDARTVQSEFATFFDVFPNGTVWGNTVNGNGYDLVLLGQVEPLHIDLDEVEARLARPDYAPVAESLREIGAGSATELFSTYAGSAGDLHGWYGNAQRNTDADLRLQYLGGWGINSSLENVLWLQILQYRRPPVGIFTGSPQRMQALFGALGGAAAAPGNAGGK